MHAAGVHLSRADDPGGNSQGRPRQARRGIQPAPRRPLGRRYRPGARACRSARSGRPCIPTLRWIGRENGSGARQCLDELLGSRRPAPRCLASNHRGVAEAVRSGWADAGVCLRLVSEEAGLDFFRVREEAYDLCFPTRLGGDHRIQALQKTVRSPLYRKALGELPGYDSTETGELQQVT